MKFLFVLDNLATGGAQRQMITLALQLEQQGHPITFFVYHPEDALAKPLYETGIKIEAVLRKDVGVPGVIRALRRLMKTGAFDVVLSFLPVPNFYTLTATFRLRYRPRIVISERLATPPQGDPWQVRLARWAYRWADWLTVNSYYQHEQLLRQYPSLKSRSQVIYNGYDLQQFCPADTPPAWKDFRILLVGRVTEQKNPECMIQALHILKSEYNFEPAVNWVGAHFDAGYTARLQQMIDAYGLGGQWHWLYEQDDIAEIMRQHHVLVHPSYYEGLSNAICEAFACGLPVIASHVQENPRLVTEGETGYVFDPTNPGELARWIYKYYTGPQQAQAMRVAARRFAEEHLSVNRFIEEYASLFNNLLSLQQMR